MAAIVRICISDIGSSRLMTQTFVCCLTAVPRSGLPVAIAKASTMIALVLPIPPAEAVTLMYFLM